MPLEPQAQRFLRLLAAAGEGACDPTAADRRNALRALARLAGEPDEAALGATRLEISPGLAAHLISPQGAGPEPRPALIYFHGGGWVAGGIDTHGGLCRRLAEASGARVIAVDYRLAPEHPFPAGLEDALTAVRWTARHARALGIESDRLAVGGDSAGGALAAAACRILRDEGGPRIVAQLLICPILDMACERGSRRAFAEGYFLSRAAMARDLADYLPLGADRADPCVSPLRAGNLAGLPPTLVHTAEFDPFRDEGHAYARRLCDAGVPAADIRHAGMIHYFYALPRQIPHALAAASSMGAQLRALLTTAA